MNLNINEVQPLHIFSEIQHYVAVDVQQDIVKVKRLGTNEIIDLTPDYVESFLKTADQFQSVVKVGKEDKYWTQKQIDDVTPISSPATFNQPEKPEVGDVRVKGIRTIWEEINSSQVFTVCYEKQGKPLSKKAYQKLLDQQEAEAVATIERARAQKKGVTEAAKLAVKYMRDNPISDFEKGEERVLRGYKIQFVSRDGRYNCIDIDKIPDNDPQGAIRPVNINTLLWIVFDNVKYEVE